MRYYGVPLIGNWTTPVVLVEERMNRGVKALRAQKRGNLFARQARSGRPSALDQNDPSSGSLWGLLLTALGVILAAVGDQMGS